MVTYMFELIIFPAQLHNGQARRLYKGNHLEISHSIHKVYLSLFCFYFLLYGYILPHMHTRSANSGLYIYTNQLFLDISKKKNRKHLKVFHHNITSNVFFKIFSKKLPRRDLPLQVRSTYQRRGFHTLQLSCLCPFFHLMMHRLTCTFCGIDRATLPDHKPACV